MKILLFSLALLGWVSLVQADWCDGDGHCWPDPYPYPGKREASSVEGSVVKREVEEEKIAKMSANPRVKSCRCTAGAGCKSCTTDGTCSLVPYCIGGQGDGNFKPISEEGSVSTRAAVGPYPYPGKREASSEEGSVEKREVEEMSAMRPRVGSCRCTAQGVCLSCTTNSTTCSQVDHCIGGEGEVSFKTSSESRLLVKSCRCTPRGLCLNCPPNRRCEEVPYCNKTSSEEGLVVKREAMMPPPPSRCTCRGPGDCKRCHLLTGNCRKVKTCPLYRKRGAVEEGSVVKREALMRPPPKKTRCTCRGPGDCERCTEYFTETCEKVESCLTSWYKRDAGAPQPYEAVPVPVAGIDN